MKLWWKFKKRVAESSVFTPLWVTVCYFLLFYFSLLCSFSHVVKNPFIHTCDITTFDQWAFCLRSSSQSDAVLTHQSCDIMCAVWKKCSVYYRSMMLLMQTQSRRVWKYSGLKKHSSSCWNEYNILQGHSWMFFMLVTNNASNRAWNEMLWKLDNVKTPLSAALIRCSWKSCNTWNVCTLHSPPKVCNL